MKTITKELTTHDIEFYYSSCVDRRGMLYEYCQFIIAHKLKEAEYRGYLFLNDIYEALGFKKTIEGLTAGWVKDSNSDSNKFIKLANLDTFKPIHESDHLQIVFDNVIEDIRPLLKEHNLLEEE